MITTIMNDTELEALSSLVDFQKMLTQMDIDNNGTPLINPISPEVIALTEELERRGITKPRIQSP
jgi:hypothetical protein